MITGINHLTLSIKDVEQSFEFYTQVLGFHPVAKWPKGAYLLAGDLWMALVLDASTRGTKSTEYTHVAFSVAPQDFAAMCDCTRYRRSEAEAARVMPTVGRFQKTKAPDSLWGGLQLS